MHKLKNIPDYPAFQKLAAALHHFGANQHGAAIMIGAGFGRSAARHVSGNKKMPLWDSFSKKLAQELGLADKTLNFSDPLRVAEEYRAYFGQSALNDQIRHQIDDEAWKPEALYSTLLGLPWSEVMTTNWDTLLERAAKEVHSPYYTPVYRPSDMAWAPTPRIVKLHGTISMTDTFVAAQEDYRTYPEKFAPFVNFVRQVFIENELCLLGFSGEDPNFLQWAGWVRDNLADHARKIYLVGALNLSAPQRVYLESINIAPIDLWAAVKDIPDSDLDIKHKKAIELFLETLRAEGQAKNKAHEWSPTSLPPREQDDFIPRGPLATFKKDRESYPGWLVCPPNVRWQVCKQILPYLEAWGALNRPNRAALLYEMAWQHGITFTDIPSWLAEALLKEASQEKHSALSKRQQMDIALVLLKSSCWLEANKKIGEKTAEEYVRDLTELLEKHAQYLPDCAAELAYHQALIARDSLDYAGMESVVEKITGEDPVWKLRQAAQLIELGRFDEGVKLIATAYGQLRESHRCDRYSIPILSRLMWARFLLNAAPRANPNQSLEELPNFVESNYREWKCDPWAWIEYIRETSNKQYETYLKNQKPIEPLFGQGSYRDNSSAVRFVNKTTEHLLLEGLTREVGIPLRLGGVFMNVNSLIGTAEKLALSADFGTELKSYTLAIRAARDESSPSIKDVFTRIGVACAPKDAVDTLLDRLLVAIDYWRKKREQGTVDQRNHALSALRPLMEVLARLVVRVCPTKAKEVFRLALAIGQQRDLQHAWLFDVLEHLLEHSLSSIPKTKQGELLADTLAFPLPNEIADSSSPSWPNPYIEHPNDRSTYANLDQRIHELIEAVAQNTKSIPRTAALLRLLPLVQNENFLNSQERSDLAAAIWGSAPDYQNLPETGLFPHTLLLLPPPDKPLVEPLLRRYFYEPSENVLRFFEEKLDSLVFNFPSSNARSVINVYAEIAAAADNMELLPTSEQAIPLFERVVTWRPKKEERDPARYCAQITGSIGHALSYAIVPALSDAEKTPERFERLKLFANEIEDAFSVIPALVYFSKIDDLTTQTIEKIIQKALHDRAANKVGYAATALHKWANLAGFTKAERPPALMRLIARLIVIIESGRTVGLQQLIWCAGELLTARWLNAEQEKTLLEAIVNAFGAANYVNIDPASAEAINASLIRAACVKVAKLLLPRNPTASSLQELLSEAKEDALPEVRLEAQR